MPLSMMSMILNQSDQLLASAVAPGDANAIKMKQRGEQFPIFERLCLSGLKRLVMPKTIFYMMKTSLLLPGLLNYI